VGVFVVVLVFAGVLVVFLFCKSLIGSVLKGGVVGRAERGERGEAVGRREVLEKVGVKVGLGL